MRERRGSGITLVRDGLVAAFDTLLCVLGFESALSLFSMDSGKLFPDTNLMLSHIFLGR